MEEWDISSTSVKFYIKYSEQGKRLSERMRKLIPIEAIICMMKSCCVYGSLNFYAQ